MPISDPDKKKANNRVKAVCLHPVTYSVKAIYLFAMQNTKYGINSLIIELFGRLSIFYEKIPVFVSECFILLLNFRVFVLLFRFSICCLLTGNTKTIKFFVVHNFGVLKFEKISRSVRVTHAGSDTYVSDTVSDTPQRLSGWNYPPAVLCWDLGLFISLAAVV